LDSSVSPQIPSRVRQLRLAVRLLVSGRFALDEASNPPPLKTIGLDPGGSRTISVGRGIALHADPKLTIRDAMLDARIVIDAGRINGLGSVIDGCSVLCTSNYCRDWALRNGAPSDDCQDHRSHG
jgi:hypothetical protein